VEISLVHQFTDNHHLGSEERNMIRFAYTLGILTQNLTGFDVVIIPTILITLGCLNCPMMAASCRNFTLSSCVKLPSRDFTATSTLGLFLYVTGLHSPRFTVPNWPLPRCSWSLQYEKVHTSRIVL